MQSKLSATPPLELDIEQVPLNAALNRRLAQDIIALHSVPPADNSAMDGYALRLADLHQNTQLPISQRIPAGTAPQSLATNSCARIFTGAELPAGADIVVMQENTEALADSVQFLHSENYTAGDNIRPKGQDISAGQLLAKRGDKITPALLGLLASQGLTSIPAQRPLIVTLISTGSEIVEPGHDLAQGQIYNSNFYAISSLLASWGCIDIKYQHVEDSLSETISAFDQSANDSDLVISFGGVSVGEEDHVKQAISSLGQLEQWKIKLKPGKPMMLATINQTPILGLPGNPVSAFVTFLLFAKPLLNALCKTNAPNTASFQVPLGFSMTKPRQRPEYLRANIVDGQVISAGKQSSGVLSSLQQCQGLALIPADQSLSAGQTVTFFPLESLIYG